MNHQARLTKHAEERLQQRGIPPLMLPIVMAYGQEQYQKGGTTVWVLPKKSAKRLRRELKDLLSRMDALSDTYFVENDAGTVITAGHQYN